uniref:Uncharacterized protein n=1 Tax=Arundo donax TaxID=35708 RepID=A0A0A9FV58_ARUDO
MRTAVCGVPLLDWPRGATVRGYGTGLASCSML